MCGVPNTAATSCCCPHRTSALFHCQLRMSKVYTSEKTSSLSIPPINHTRLPTNVAECIARGGMPGGKLATGLPILHVALSKSNTSLYMADLQVGLRKVLRCLASASIVEAAAAERNQASHTWTGTCSADVQDSSCRGRSQIRHIPSAPCSYQDLSSG